MKKIKFSNINKYFYVDEEDYEKICKYKWRYTKNNVILTNYFNNKNNYTTKTLCCCLFPKFKGQVKCFLDGNPFNFCKNNVVFYVFLNKSKNKKLKECNLLLRERYNKRYSKYRGVQKDDNKYIVKINYNKNHYYLGRFENEIEAAKEYDKKAKEFLGRKAILNFK